MAGVMGFLAGSLLTRPDRLATDAVVEQADAARINAEQQLIHLCETHAAEIKNIRARLNKLQADTNTKLATIDKLKKLNKDQVAEIADLKKIVRMSNKPSSMALELAAREIELLAQELRTCDNWNMKEIFYKLKLIAIENDTIDTRSYHNHINQVKSNQKARLDLIDLLEKTNLAALKSDEPAIWKDLFEMIKDTQEITQQRRLEAIKAGDITTFDKIEEISTKLYQGFRQDIEKQLAKYNSGEN